MPSAVIPLTLFRLRRIGVAFVVDPAPDRTDRGATSDVSHSGLFAWGCHGPEWFGTKVPSAQAQGRDFVSGTATRVTSNWNRRYQFSTVETCS
ncbi:hypothetical protein RE9431_11460 [Prescottella equi]|nr:hypothetical protein RE9414_11630 [Prescottella equi]BCN47807.1 hypothetical protein RE9416_11080 [Prescottella equi]BCN52875.1 hypothetical protein RE9425_12650 [Prescottella equi]BCN57773.1 hypothetical protein RE9427_11430 [Prescottella equi]BCN62691.1 hypothetical protein RE9431_11460 [Prescottella equi]